MEGRHQSTGNAQRSVCSPVLAAPTNFFRPGKKDLNGQLADMGEGLLIMELAGLHAGASPFSGDFSLIAKGFRIKDGKQGAPMKHVTIAGYFYQLLKDIQAVGSDLAFKGSGIGPPLRGYWNHPCCRKMMFISVSVCLIRCHVVSLTVRKSGTSDAFTWFVKIGEPKETGKAECFLNEKPILHPRQLK